MTKPDNLSLLRRRAHEQEAMSRSMQVAQAAAEKDKREAALAWSGVFELLRELGKVETAIWERTNGEMPVVLVQAVDEASVDYGAFLELVRFLKARGQYELIPRIEIIPDHLCYSTQLRERLRGEENAGLFLLQVLTVAGEKGMTKKRLARQFRDMCAEVAAVLPEWFLTRIVAESLPHAFRRASIEALRHAEDQARIERRSRLHKRIVRKTAIRRDLALLALAERVSDHDDGPRPNGRGMEAASQPSRQPLVRLPRGQRRRGLDAGNSAGHGHDEEAAGAVEPGRDGR